MLKVKHLAAVAAVSAATVAPGAFAGVTGNVGAVSEYYFRGLQQDSNGQSPAIQGGLDWSGDSGLYAGTWASNVNWGAGNVELDLYGGYAGKLGDLGYDVGGIFYYYPGADQPADATDASPVSVPKANTVEAYIKLSYSYFGLQYYYSPRYFGLVNTNNDDVSSSYLAGSFSYPVTSSISFNASVGYTMLSDDVLGDGPNGFATTNHPESKSNYLDYNVGLSKAIDDTLSATFSVIGTNFSDDSPQVVVGLKKSFSM